MRGVAGQQNIRNAFQAGDGEGVDSVVKLKLAKKKAMNMSATTGFEVFEKVASKELGTKEKENRPSTTHGELRPAGSSSSSLRGSIVGRVKKPSLISSAESDFSTSESVGLIWHALPPPSPEMAQSLTLGPTHISEEADIRSAAGATPGATATAGTGAGAGLWAPAAATDETIRAKLSDPVPAGKAQGQGQGGGGGGARPVFVNTHLAPGPPAPTPAPAMGVALPVPVPSHPATPTESRQAEEGAAGLRGAPAPAAWPAPTPQRLEGSAALAAYSEL